MYHALTIGLEDDLITDLQKFFLKHDLHFTSTSTIQMAGKLLVEKVFHLLIVNLEYLRDIGQIHWLSNLRHSSFAPVIVLSNTPDLDFINTVDLGADICIPKKWPHTEIAELLHAQLRRYTEYNHYSSPEGSEIAPFQIRDIFIDPPRRTVKVRGAIVNLRPREFSLLLYFMKNPDIVLTPEMISEHAWGIEGNYGHNVSQSVHILRQAIEEDTEKPVYIQTVYRTGYRFLSN